MGDIFPNNARMQGLDGTKYRPISVDTNGNLVTSEKSRTALYETASDTNFVVGDSPFDFDVNTALGKNGTEFIVLCDGPGDILVEISNDGTAFSDSHPMKSGETFSIDNVSIDTIRITHVTDSAYRIVAL